jgi:hypothetical protein
MVVAALAALAVPAAADEACRKAVEDAFTKQRQSKAFRSEVTNPAAEDGSKQVFEYIPPLLMHRVVTTPTLAEPMESVGFGNRAWMLESSGWMEMQPHFAESHKNHLADLFGQPVSIKSDYSCLGTVTLEGQDLIGYRTAPELGSDGIALIRTVYVDPKTGLPAANVVGDDKGEKPALVREIYSYPGDLKIEVPEGAPMQSMQH